MAAQSCDGTALVTAAAGRIGRAIAARLAPRWALVLHEMPAFAREAEEMAERLRAAGGRVAVVAADLADVAATGTLVERASATLAPPSLLINAATQFATDRSGFEAAAWAELFALNLRAPCQLAERFAAALPPGAEGAIVNLVDRRLWHHAPRAQTYELSQAALWSATETLARAYAPAIRVNAVGPAKELAADAAIAGGARPEMPLAGDGAPEAIAKAVSYLANATAVTGQMIAIAP